MRGQNKAGPAEIAAKYHITKKAADKMIGMAVDTAAVVLPQGNKLTLYGFGTLEPDPAGRDGPSLQGKSTRLDSEVQNRGAAARPGTFGAVELRRRGFRPAVS